MRPRRSNQLAAATSPRPLRVGRLAEFRCSSASLVLAPQTAVARRKPSAKLMCNLL